MDIDGDLCLESCAVILTREAFENAIRVLHAISGSTNAILHLIAYAGRVGVELPLQLFDELCESTPWLVDLKPAGRFLLQDRSARTER